MDLDIAPIFNLNNQLYRKKFEPPQIPKPPDAAEEEEKYRQARRDKQKRMQAKLKSFNNKYKSQYEELEMEVHLLAKEGSSYGREMSKR